MKDNKYIKCGCGNILFKINEETRDIECAGCKKVFRINMAASLCYDKIVFWSKDDE